MHRLLCHAALPACYLLIWVIPVTADDLPLRRMDPATVLGFFDADADEKLSKDEFLKLAERSTRLKANAALAAQVFKRLDVDGDGYLSRAEYSQLGNSQGGRPAEPSTAVEKTTKVAGPVATPIEDQTAFFEKKIRPVLVDRCYSCHSAEAEKFKGGLALDTREGLRTGGDSGPSIVPGAPDKSLLIRALRHTDDSLMMPPKGKLPDAVVADFERWVAMGAPDPRVGAAKQLSKEQDTWDTATDWWAWQPPKNSPAPEVKDDNWPKTEIDRFLLAALDAKGLKPVGDANKLTLLRRVTFDLTGLPPSTEDINAFIKDESPDALTKVADRLLASPQFGEKWGRHWLDVARYAESTGKDVNLAYPNAWRYRDYVIAAFNKDKPYDQFLREQIAGDLLPAKDGKQRAEQLVATGFLAIGTKSVNQANSRQFALDLADEQIDTISQALLGVTAACARCHDHKFDPISQKDYYALAGIFLSTDTHYGTFFAAQNRSATKLLELPKEAGAPVLPQVMTKQERAEKQAELAELLREANDMAEATFKPAANRNPRGQLLLLLRMNQIGLLESDLDSFGPDGKMRPLAMGVLDQPVRREEARGASRRQLPSYESSTPDQAIATRFLDRDGRFARPPEFRIITDSPMFDRGDVNKPGDKVARGFPSALTSAPAPKIPAGSSGRLELTEWMLVESNPLTSRVMVNRVWQQLFGTGLVRTPDNFGTTGALPSNQLLLDTLAVQFREQGWSVKGLIREIVLSRAYQLSSTFDEKNFAADPENALVWRMSKRRLDAEAIRDAVLAASGQLELRPTIGSPIAERGNGPIGQFRQFPGVGVPEDVLVEAGARTNVRSVYLPIARELLPDALAVFDFAEPGFVNGRRDATNVPAQALFLLNSGFVADASQKFAERLIAAYPEASSFDERVQLAYRLAFSRAPTEAERQAASNFFSTFPGSSAGSNVRAGAASTAETDAWTSFCRVLFAIAEFRYLQ